jgi:hypothetical protein
MVPAPRAGEDDQVSPLSSRPPVFVLSLGALLGALTWAVWLGWDRTTSYDVITGTVQTPYVTLQVLGCALTVGVVTAVLAAVWHSAAAAVGVSLGFWLVWTAYAASQDGSGLYAVGSLMLAVGLAGGTALAASVGAWVRTATDAVRRRRTPRDGFGEPGIGAG